MVAAVAVTVVTTIAAAMRAAMTDRARSLPVATIAGALFAIVLIYLALEVRAGRDPAIGEMKPAASAPRQVIVRRIIVRRVVVDDAPPAPGSAARSAPSRAGAPPPAPPAAAPAPAPAPAPVVSRGS